MVKRIRADLFICLVLASLIIYLLLTLCGKLGMEQKITNLFDSFNEKNVTEVADGDIGGYALDETPRVTNMEELINYSDNFTLEMSNVSYIHFGTFTGDEYEWHIFSLSDNTMIAARVNSDKVQKIERDSENQLLQQTKVILPVGKIVLEEPEILDKMEDYYSDDYNIIIDAYIDMDGIANYSKISSSLKLLYKLLPLLIVLIPLSAFAIYIGLVFAIHYIFYKLGVFPPVFAKKNKINN